MKTTKLQKQLLKDAEQLEKGDIVPFRRRVEIAESYEPHGGEVHSHPANSLSGSKAVTHSHAVGGHPAGRVPDGGLVHLLVSGRAKLGMYPTACGEPTTAYNVTKKKRLLTCPNCKAGKKVGENKVHLTPADFPF